MPIAVTMSPVMIEIIAELCSLLSPASCYEQNVTTSDFASSAPAICSATPRLDPAVESGATRPRMSYVYASLGCTAQCGRCVRTIKAFLKESIDVDDGKSITSRTDVAAR